MKFYVELKMTFNGNLSNNPEILIPIEVDAASARDVFTITDLISEVHRIYTNQPIFVLQLSTRKTRGMKYFTLSSLHEAFK